jgi:hypothetical protein
MDSAKSRLRHLASSVSSRPDAFERLSQAKARKETRRRRGGLIAGVSVVVSSALLLTWAMWPSSVDVLPSSRSTFAADGQCLSEDEDGLLTCEQAIEVAAEKAGTPDDHAASGVEARLDWHQSPGSPSDVRVWIVTYKNALQQVRGPSQYRGSRCSRGDWDIVLAAHSGDLLVEGGSATVTTCPTT